MKSDYDVSGSVGGPILKDRLWFYSVVRQQRTHKLPVGTDFWPNLWEGKWGYNYQPDRPAGVLSYTNRWSNVNGRFTWQASQRNKFNIFWDEQDFCQDPCEGVISVYTSPESWSSNQIRPNRLQQIKWTNPFTSKLLFEAGLNVSAAHYNTTEHRKYVNPRTIPRISESGTSTANGAMAAGGDAVAPRVNQFAGGATALTSGSVNGGFFELRKMDNYRTTASASYITGSHNAKIGWDGAYYLQDQTGAVNDLRMTYTYTQPATTCATNNTCGTVLAAQFPDEAVLGNPFRRPRPSSVTFSTGVRTLKDRVWYGALYLQDQWTLDRFTLTGALRYDHAASRYGSTCTGGPGEPFARLQADGTTDYCTPETDGVSYNDISPRFGAVWDLFGDGKTAIKWNMGKYLSSAGISGLYTGANPARNTVNTLARNWTDTDGDRIVDCDLLNTANNNECGAFTSSAGDVARFGLDPFASPLGLATVQCGRQSGDIIISPEAAAYCATYGDSLVNGWGKRGYEWQLGLGVQRELLPRLSGEVTYNRRLYRNLTSNDQIGVGCDRFNAQDTRTCQDAYLNYQGDAFTDFYEYVAPLDPRLAGGGGYRVLGLTTPRATAPAGGVTMVTLDPERNYYWHGVDTNFVWRAPFGLRINGGTSTSRASRETCYAMYDGPGTNLQGREGHEYEAGCRRHVPFLTRINGTASYTIPWVDVLVATVFQSIPGAEIGASVQNVLATDPNITWLRPERLNEPCTGTDAGSDPNNPNRGCFGATRNSLEGDIDILIQNELWGERTTLFDIKVAKTFRFGNRRVQVGMDLYNAFNSNAIQSYEGNYDPADQQWLAPRSVVQPRVARFSVQFSF